MEYKTTKEQCADKIKGICSQCGGGLEPLETIDNAGSPTFWSGCKKCQRFDHGTDPKVYAIAKRMVEERHYRYYDHIHIEANDSPEMKQYKTNQQISGACGIVVEVLSLNNEI